MPIKDSFFIKCVVGSCLVCFSNKLPLLMVRIMFCERKERRGGEGVKEKVGGREEGWKERLEGEAEREKWKKAESSSLSTSE